MLQEPIDPAVLPLNILCFEITTPTKVSIKMQLPLRYVNNTEG